ncbi:probable receptor-like protein kinase At5g20050 [Phoenix dactylifera]|uniref:Probable receptor-like protein kinase At5g20050 n=1 Tax=Phoenix dactylifera TaxID=42345 RepID=A0A8B7BXF1_PHODC|nr:probable receptor-like protein kinase At5g20050 [Phoenix dactylifera]
MEAKKAAVVVCIATTVLLLALILLFSFLGMLSKTLFTVVAIAFAVVVVIAVWLFVHHAIINQRRKSAPVRRSVVVGEELRLEYSFLQKVAGLPRKFSYRTLEAATDNFQALLGRGSSASVFKGILDDGTAIAVKRIEGTEHGDKEFRSEIAAIASIQHVNLVRLLGYCLIPGGPYFLVYEFIHNGSLENWIFSREECSRCRCLPWALRYQVAIDVAKALAYLHHDCRSRVLHLDIKPENILLDESFRAVVSDFGLSKLMSKDQSRVVTTVRGTRGYLAPEWLLENGISEKSDIYSYGMVLLELVGGRRNVCLVGDGDRSQRKWSYFPRIVAEKVREGRIMEVVDERLRGEGGGVEEKQVRTLVDVALWCIQEKAKLRPSMARAVDMLEGRMAVDVPPETQMIVVDLLAIDQLNSDDGRFGLRAAAGAASQACPSESKHPTSSSTCSLAMSALSGR